HVDLQRVVTAVALGVPEEAAREILVGTRAHRYILRTLGHAALARGRSDPACLTARGAGANLRRNAIRIDTQQTMHAKRSDVRQANRHIGIQLPLYREIPLLNCRYSCIGLDSLRCIRGAGLWNTRAARGRYRRAGNQDDRGERSAISE